MFRALPGYFGGKQKLVGTIFKYAPTKTRFLDAFMGGGSVSLYAKLRGHDVIANDHSFFSEIVGRAIIENNGVKLSASEVWRAIGIGVKEEPAFNSEIESKFDELFLPTDQVVLKSLIRAGHENTGPKKWLLLLLALKYSLAMQSFGDWRKNAVTEFQSRLFTTLSVTKTNRIRVFKQNREKILNDDIDFINNAIVPGDAVFWKKDVFEAIKKSDAKTIYLDPPYGGASQTYEQINFWKNYFLSNEVHPGETTNEFNEEKGLNSMKRLAEACEASEAKTVILSYWTKCVSAETLAEWFKEFNLKKVPLKAYHYSYGGSTADGNHEYLGVGSR